MGPINDHNYGNRNIFKETRQQSRSVSVIVIYFISVILIGIVFGEKSAHDNYSNIDVLLIIKKFNNNSLMCIFHIFSFLTADNGED